MSSHCIIVVRIGDKTSAVARGWCSQALTTVSRARLNTKWKASFPSFVLQQFNVSGFPFRLLGAVIYERLSSSNLLVS
jgi:hypothetical protein